MKNLTFGEAEGLALEGKFIKLPEWRGFWFVKDGDMKVFTSEGRILDTPMETFKERGDWEVTTGLRDIGGAIEALKLSNGVVEFVKRKGDPNYKISIERVGRKAFLTKSFKNISPVEWVPSNEDLLAIDYIVATPEILGLDRIF